MTWKAPGAPQPAGEARAPTPAPEAPHAPRKASHGRPAGTFDHPPGGRCAVCRAEATKWIGAIDESGGRRLRVGVGVCDACMSRILAGEAPVPSVLGLLEPG